MEDLREKNSRSNEFRYVYANGITTIFNGNESILVFGIKESFVALSNVMREEIAIVMSPITLKSLAMTLGRVVEDFENRTGQIIPIDEIAKDAVEKAISRVGE